MTGWIGSARCIVFTHVLAKLGSEHNYKSVLPRSPRWYRGQNLNSLERCLSLLERRVLPGSSSFWTRAFGCFTVVATLLLGVLPEPFFFLLH